MRASVAAMKKAAGYDNPAMADIHHIDPTLALTPENAKVMDPVEHLKYHDCWRDIIPDYEGLRILMDDRQKVQSWRIGNSNRMLAADRGTDKLVPLTKKMAQALLSVCGDREKQIDVEIHLWMKAHKKNPVVKTILSAPGVGPILAACFLYEFDPNAAPHASSYWKHCGYAGSSHDRYTKGQASGGRKSARTLGFKLSTQWCKAGGKGEPCFYLVMLRQRKMKTSASSRMIKHTFRQSDGKTQTVEVEWMSDHRGMPAHRDMDARRIAIKAFLADWWFVSRTLLRLPTDSAYAEAHLGHERTIIDPAAHGWDWSATT